MKASDRIVRASLTAMGVDLTLIAIKAIQAAATGSLALVADAWHSSSDLVVSLAVLVGVLVRRRSEAAAAPSVFLAGAEGAATPATGATRSGGRLESWIAYAVSMAILYVPYEIVTSIREGSGRPVQRVGIAVVGLLACIGLSWFAARLKLTVGKEADSPTLAADGWHSWTDMLSSVAVLLSVMGGLAGVNIDSLVAAGIAALIGLTGLELLASSVLGLIRGTAPQPVSIGAWLKARLSVSSPPGAEEKPAPAVEGPGLTPPATAPAPARSLAWLRLRLPRRAPALFAGLAAVVWLASGLILIEQDEVGIRLRFGARVAPELEPGLHLVLPWPLETVRRVPSSIARLEIGFRSVSGVQSSELLWDATRAGGGGVRLEDESLALTGDEGAVAVSFVIHYRASDPVRFAMGANGVEGVLRSLAESQVRETLATEPVDRLLTEDRAALFSRVRAGLVESVVRLKLGIEIVNVLCRELHPPFETVSAFRDAFTAREDQLKVLNQAEAYQNESLP
ncbi:MAG: protease modulator HflK family protein, partial [Deltaproteobacteria bacterium]|nr:protease modulator HflK family protein [Deltaproteobacteria bacterium]